MPEFTKCPHCGLSAFSSRSARDVHVHRCKKKKTQSISQPSSENKHEVKPPELYTRFDGRKAPLTEAELINEGIDWLRSRITGKKPSPQFAEPVRQLTVTDLANLRARELNGEIPSQFEAYTPPSYEQQQPAQTQPSAQIYSRPTFNVVDAIKSVVSKVFPQKKKEFPLRPVNIYGQPMAHWRCYTCWEWVSDTQIALHQAENHTIEHIW